MGLLPLVHVVQTDPAVIESLERIARLQLVVAIALGVIAVAFAIAGAWAVATLVQVRRMLVAADSTLRRLAPRADPAVDRARRVMDDVGDAVEEMRERMGQLSDTLARFNRSLRRAGRGAETRVREFTAVLDVVREEAQELLMDTAATAHGIHATAEALRAPRRISPVAPQPPPPLPEEVRRSHGEE